MNNSDVIDLSNSFTLVEHYTLNNTVIEIDSDDSLDRSVFDFKSKKASKTTNKDTDLKPHTSPKSSENYQNEKSNKLGKCTICWDELGTNPLASTKCGHVYCLTCLEESLKQEKRCPICRCSLKRKSAYHPLYLNR